MKTETSEHLKPRSQYAEDAVQLAITGKWDEAVSYWQRALAIQQKLAPNSLDLAGSLGNLGTEAGERGKLDEEEERQLLSQMASSAAAAAGH